MSILVFLSKWLHLLSIAGVVGWTAYGWLGLSPVLKDQAGSDVSKELWKRFGIGVGVLWVIALATGAYNAVGVSPRTNEAYHTILGAKIALAVVMFLVTLVIAHPMPGLNALSRLRYPMLSIVLGLGVCVVGISAYLNISRTAGFGLKAAPAPSAVAPAPAPLAPALPGVPR